MASPSHDPLKRLIYRSEVSNRGPNPDLADILHRSRVNNGLDGITGLLWSDGHEFIQVIEGGAEAVNELMARIMTDDRHHNLRILSDLAIEARAFTYWTMASVGPGGVGVSDDARLGRSISEAPADVQAAFAQRF